jgi:nucleotide-binding universal stress UspA family protein
MSNRIVVGVDDSEGARHALRWAVEHAASFDATVEAVHVYDFRPPWIDYEEGAETLERWRSLAAEHAKATLDNVIQGTLDPSQSRTVVALTTPGDAAGTLVNHAKDAQLLVVGSRGRGAFKGLLLGSVSRRCAEYAPCPVVVIPPARR